MGVEEHIEEISETSLINDLIRSKLPVGTNGPDIPATPTDALVRSKSEVIAKTHAAKIRTAESQNITKYHNIERARQLIELSTRQRIAIDLLVMGASDNEVSIKIGTARETVTRWRLYHPAFRAELNRERRDVWGGSADQLRTLLRHSLGVLDDVLNDPAHPKRADIALGLVKGSGLFVELNKMDSTKISDVIDIVKEEIGMDLHLSAEGLLDRGSYRFYDFKAIMDWFKEEESE